MVPRRTLVASVAALALVAPARALAQSAGDNQYQDPFAGQGGSSGGSGGSATPTPQPSAPAPTAPAPASTPAAPTAQAQPAPAGPQLPYTGSPVDAGLLAAAGGLLLAGGVTLRVRLRGQR
jgi:hypothetical protein